MCVKRPLGDLNLDPWPPHLISTYTYGVTTTPRVCSGSPLKYLNYSNDACGGTNLSLRRYCSLWVKTLTDLLNPTSRRDASHPQHISLSSHVGCTTHVIIGLVVIGIWRYFSQFYFFIIKCALISVKYLIKFGTKHFWIYFFNPLCSD